MNGWQCRYEIRCISWSKEYVVLNARPCMLVFFKRQERGKSGRWELRAARRCRTSPSFNASYCFVTSLLMFQHDKPLDIAALRSCCTREVECYNRLVQTKQMNLPRVMMLQLDPQFKVSQSEWSVGIEKVREKCMCGTWGKRRNWGSREGPKTSSKMKCEVMQNMI